MGLLAVGQDWLMTRVRAPELRGRGWLNTGGRELTLKDFRGQIVLLDFWTFCCINCLHVLDELRPLEEKYADVLVIVGVHSPKFEHERDPEALAAAVERYGVAHPVLDDPDLITWDQYAAKAWPTLSVVDPEGYVVASMAGEGHAEGLARLSRRAGGRPTPNAARCAAVTAPTCPRRTRATALRFPGKAIVGPARHAAGGRLGPSQRGRAGPERRWTAGATDRLGRSGVAATARPPRQRSPSRAGCACCRPTSRPRSGTTWSSPTRSTTSCAASTWPRAM